MQVSSSNNLTSPRYPLPYEHNQHCAWILTTHPGSKIAVTFLECDLQPAIGMECQDFVQIQDGRLGKSSSQQWISVFLFEASFMLRELVYTGAPAPGIQQRTVKPFIFHCRTFVVHNKC